MVYYLDTNFLRSRHSQLGKLIDDSENSYYTSWLSISELISGMETPEEFKLRKKVLASIEKVNLVIDWETPREKLNKSFDCITFFHQAKYDLKECMKIIINSNTIEEAIQNCENRGINVGIKELIKLDQRTNELFCIHTNNLKNHLSKDKRKLTRFDFYDSNTGIIPEDRIEEGVVDLVKKLALSLTDKANISENAIFSSYNKSIHLYHQIMFIYQIEILVQERTAAKKNDYLDISHFLYIPYNNLKDYTIVTDDKIFESISKKYSLFTQIRNKNLIVKYE